MIDSLKHRRHKLRWQLFFVLLLSGTVSLCLFRTLWHGRNHAYDLLHEVPFLHLPAPSDTILMDIADAAAHYEVPESEKDTLRIEKLQPFFSIADEYTSIYIYGTIDGLYRAGQYASRMDNPNFQSFFDTGYSLTEAAGEEYYKLTLKFKNGYADVMLYFYHSSLFMYPYLYFCIVFCIFSFLAAVLSFISRKMRRIALLEKEILHMSAGDLNHPVPVMGYDEIGSLAKELDCLRLALSSNIRKEQESRRANQDLITAMSHDLRTPLTILNGYLEILRLGRAPASSGEYLDRCLKKTKEIREMTDRMFEYALVYEESETAKRIPLPAAFWKQCLMEHADYLRLAGFTVEVSLPEVLPQGIPGDETMLRRVFSNLFSNILKYGDKKMQVSINCMTNQQTFTVTLSNFVRQEYVKTESTHIGLKSVQKMMTLMSGMFEIQRDEECFEVMLTFPLP